MKGHILIVDDEPDLRELFSELLKADGHSVKSVEDGAKALAALGEEDFDLVVSDICMPGASGLDFLRSVHALDRDLKVILVTGQPSMETAIEALEYGAIQYLRKPVPPEALHEAVQKGLKLHRMSALQQEALAFLQRREATEAEGKDVSALLDRALSGLWMAYQPIVSAKDASVYGHEALVRSAERGLPDPGALFAAAESTGRVWEVGRAVRDLVASAIPETGATRFLNLHPIDLEDPRLYSPSESLSRQARHVVLEVTERASLSSISEIRRRVRDLKAMGFRLAIDDLGAGYAELTSFVVLEPEVAKLDMLLVRDIEREPVKRTLVSSMVKLCRELGILTVAEGVETPAEREVLVDLGCDLLQGFLFGRPSFLPAVAVA